MQTTPSGLQYNDTAEGNGATATKGQRVKVHYTGWLYNDGTWCQILIPARTATTRFVFHLGAGMVIKGWDEGVAGMKVGGARTLIIPAAVGVWRPWRRWCDSAQRHVEVRRGTARHRLANESKR